jgi:hypothetical protein
MFAFGRHSLLLADHLPSSLFVEQTVMDQKLQKTVLLKKILSDLWKFLQYVFQKAEEALERHVFISRTELHDFPLSDHF